MIRDTQPNTPLILIQANDSYDRLLMEESARRLNPTASIHTFSDAVGTEAGIRILLGNRAGSKRPGVLITDVVPVKNIARLPDEHQGLEATLRTAPDLHNLMKEIARQERNDGWRGIVSSFSTPEGTINGLRKHGLALPEDTIILPRASSERGSLRPNPNIGKLTREILDTAYVSIARASGGNDEITSSRMDETTPPMSKAS